MTKLFFARNNFQLPPVAFKALVASLPMVMQIRTGEFYRWQDRQAYVIGKLMLQHALLGYGKHLGLEHVNYGDNGRPYINSVIDFNLAHSGGYVTCVISDECRVGIDIEEIKPINIEELKQAFNAVEWPRIAVAYMGGDSRLFYEYWTLKEAAVKADGSGMGIPLQEVAIQDGHIVVAGKPWLFASVYLAEKYVVHIVSSAKIVPPGWQEFSW